MAIIPGNIDDKLRIKDDLTYNEYKEEMTSAFGQYEKYGATPEQVTNFLTHEDWNDEMYNTTSAFLWYVAMAVREIELGILEERVRAQISYHIPLYDQGKYHDLDLDEKELLGKDIAYIKTKVNLIPVDQLKEA